MVLIRKEVLDNLYKEIDELKITVKKQKQMFEREMIELKRRSEKLAKQRRLLMRQSEYLQDMSPSSRSLESRNFLRTGFYSP